MKAAAPTYRQAGSKTNVSAPYLGIQNIYKCVPRKKYLYIYLNVFLPLQLTSWNLHLMLNNNFVIGHLHFPIAFLRTNTNATFLRAQDYCTHQGWQKNDGFLDCILCFTDQLSCVFGFFQSAHFRLHINPWILNYIYFSFIKVSLNEFCFLYYKNPHSKLDSDF